VDDWVRLLFWYGLIETSFGTMDMIFSGFDDCISASWFARARSTRFAAPGAFLLADSGLALFAAPDRAHRGRPDHPGRICQPARYPLDARPKLLYLPVVFASQVLAMGALFIIGATLTFWTVQSVEAMNILTYGGTEMMSYPVRSTRVDARFFTYVIPFVFLNYYPALYFLDKPDPLNLPPVAPFLAPLVAVVMFFLALRFWKFGMDHYQSTGS
jgi:ABC-2 type transport system permease protein